MSKGPGVQKMFDAIAPNYDLMNRVMTMGQDQRWRRFVVGKAGDPGQGWVLDLATGTGDIASLMGRSYQGAHVIGADFSLNMLQEAKKRFQEQTIAWQACDANYLPYKDSSFESVTFGYLLRNVDDSLRVLKEVYRVLKPGGRVICLDTTPPEKNIFYPFVRFYFRFGIPFLGRLIASDEAAYAYLTGSTMDFHNAEELAGIFTEAGFVKVDYKKFMMGTIGVHWGQKS
ncbi:MAG: bifunctional demethylmenaquinone methyltransferase/2-methoxy-6-polyprenyl-1,4-benzoquinol methylase UbiE [Proteobacteria bacterium]|nr:bifunctional demethylmenaquinone methyltransferase/2-methoxy-6-polyprenyl-1,4-benzoquinol methylase UbiE [Pseudomonadota bacterium]MBU1139053.1 bifunctional demethylmenaquinone methyltransferase/2-methoxy-6-polyprenyl-1,4-benzoquinol methylase UbiE [Pseudomonadota bacterium]MBU1233754.1 bifunctional demethylmenaquinone methyltransferase/2-methoxy-6-polyprenyl-1,4-benzoquinol methylase UbiE [Pseudomonadota bacterium]MBU1419595.1 bifunctional demethylmenaquinone methyltransferase/2-methoxy-6-po